MTPRRDIIVIGAGAAGLMAAGRAAERGAHVLLLEKMGEAGKKILVTGGAGFIGSHIADAYVAVSYTHLTLPTIYPV